MFPPNQTHGFTADELAETQHALNTYPDNSPFWDSDAGQDALWIAKRAGLESTNTQPRTHRSLSCHAGACRGARVMRHPGPYIPATRDRIGARIEWLARLALWEAHEAASEARRRIGWPAWLRYEGGPFDWARRYEVRGGVMSDPRVRDYERMRNAEAREQVEGLLNNHGDAGMQNALNNPNPTRINPAAFPWGEYYEGDTTVTALNDLARACGYR